ncbi:MAG: isochorismatase family protein [Candidatus Tectomicrobia bacterium]|uniref:Isochorismatase family protein n=1 Tax=Tectimicrobiota bacterium TaxID=2528274 RepID=A0A937W1F8_UNCTE|nr:isochorismatase family protein [Candidatus Tectomicrobia bacterium]
MPTVTAAPFPYTFPERGVALLVIDMQRDFLEPDGFGAALGNDVAPLAAIVPTVRRLLDACRACRLPIIHTKEAHRADLTDCPPAKRQRGTPALRIGDHGPMGRILIAGEPGNAIVPALTPWPGETVLEKPGKGAFYRTPLQELLTTMGITHLLVAGVTTEVCVQTTLREANDRGYECLLVEDATASYFPAFKQATLEMIRAQGGIVGWTAPAEQVLQALGQITPQEALAPIRCEHLLHAPALEVACRWEPFRDGIDISPLYGDQQVGPAAALLRYRPGASLPLHHHAGYEHVFVLAGSQTDHNGVYGAGTLVINPPGSRHRVVSTDGCLVLVIWEKPVIFETAAVTVPCL